MAQIATVSSLVGYLKRSLDRDYKIQNLLIKGEISNFTHHRSGHFYFTLKDEKSRISCVMFRANSSKVKFEPKEGDMVLLNVNTSVYEGSGQLQLYVNAMQLDGIGDLYLEFEKLKKKLQSEGLFDQQYKKRINRYPEKIAVIVGKNTAAREDVVSTLARRWPYALLKEFHVLVQGENSSRQIIDVLNSIEKNSFDTVIIARGGGSIEDLWSFNSEALARVIFSFHTPIISGVGHESDTTIVDYVADLRAPTPTGAAEMACFDIRDVKTMLYNYQSKISANLNNQVKYHRNNLVRLIDSQVFRDPYYLTKNKHLRLEYNYQKLLNYTNIVNQQKSNLDRYETRLNNLLLVLLSENNEKISKYQQSLINTIQHIYKDKVSHFQKSVALLDAYSPLAVLSRGYSLTYKGNELLRSVKDVDINEEIKIKLSDGNLTASVKEKSK